MQDILGCCRKQTESKLEKAGSENANRKRPRGGQREGKESLIGQEFEDQWIMETVETKSAGMAREGGGGTGSKKRMPP